MIDTGIQCTGTQAAELKRFVQPISGGRAKDHPARPGDCWGFQAEMERDILVIGASAGGVHALQILAAALPRDLPAAVLVVLHIPPWGRSELPAILTRSGPLPAVHARDNEQIERGRIYVAPPDHHLILEGQRTVLWRGPKENRNRPAINALFRSAAVAQGERVTGVVLTGALDDGSAGLWWINHHGGAAVVQDPCEAAFPEMPRSALEYVPGAYMARLSQLGPLLTVLAKGKDLEVCKQKRA